MSNKQSLYTKYRPMNFNEVIGQNVAKDILINSIIKNKINHAYLFYGIRGTGKTTLARIFAKAINCKNLSNNNPCNICESCKAINNGSAFDVIEIDAASNNGVDEIRSIKENTSFSTTALSYKVYIIDEVHMLTKQAFNALLKTLEEPPRNTIFLLATTEMNKIPKTVLSRTVTINLEVLSDEDVKKGLRVILNGENISFEEESLSYLVMISGGSLRDAISFLEATLLFSDDLTVANVIKSLGLINKQEVENYLKNDVNTLIDKIGLSDKDPKKILIILLEVLIDLVKKGERKYFSCLNSIISSASNISDPSLLKLSLKTALLNINNIDVLEEEKIIVSRETEKIDNFNNKEEEIIVSNENNEIIEKTENNESFNVELNLENDKLVKEEENLKETTVPLVEEGLNVITDFVDVNNYMYGIMNNNNTSLAKFQGRWRHIENYITSIEYKEVVSSLVNTKPLSTAGNILIVGFDNKQQLNEFKRISLTNVFFDFIKEIISEYIFILPIDEETWSKLIAVKNSGYQMSEKNKEVDLKFENFLENADKKKLDKVNELFGERNVTHE